MKIQSLLSVTLIASVAWCQQQGVRQDNNNGSDDLQIVVIQGEDGANIVQDGTFAETIVEVRDRNNLPIVGGAIVTAGVVWAVASHTGGSTPGAFPTGSNTVTVTADTNGRAVISGFRPQGTGQVNIQVQASYQGHTGHTTIHQTNFPTAAAAAAAGKTPGAQQSQESNLRNSVQSSSKAASGGGHGLLIGTLVVAGAAGGAGAAYAAGLFGKKDTGGGNSCDATQVTNANNSTFQCIGNNVFNLQACTSTFQTFVNAANAYCNCEGTSTIQTQTLASNLRSAASSLGVGYSTTCR